MTDFPHNLSWISNAYYLLRYIPTLYTDAFVFDWNVNTYLSKSSKVQYKTIQLSLTRMLQTDLVGNPLLLEELDPAKVYITVVNDLCINCTEYEKSIFTRKRYTRGNLLFCSSYFRMSSCLGARSY